MKLSETVKKLSNFVKIAGFFSWECSACNKSILSDASTDFKNGWMKQCVLITSDGKEYIGEYDGYGRIGDEDGEMDIVEEDLEDQGFTIYHKACWKIIGRPGFKDQSNYSNDQGFFVDEKIYEISEPKNRDDLENIKNMNLKNTRGF